MTKFNSVSISLRSLWTIFITLAIPLIGVCGASLIPYMLRTPLMYLTLALTLIVFVFTDTKIRFSAPNVIFFLLTTYIAVSILFSLDSENSVNLLLIYLCCFPMLFLNLSGNTINRIFKIIYVISIVIALSIIISVPIKNCMNTYFWFIVNPTRSAATTEFITDELSRGSYSGFAREMGEAAFIMNVGIAVSFSKFFTNHKFTKKQFVVTAIQLVALMLTGKRTYLFASLICFLLFFLFSRVKGKFFKLSAIILFGSIAVFLLMMFIPQTANAINKMLNNENTEILGGRAFLWKHIYSMIDDHWMFGAGFGSYNMYAYQHGLLVNGEMWKYNAHNCYLQILGELGVIGLTLFVAFIVSSLVISINAIRSEKENKNKIAALYFSLYIQIMMIIYALTGNPLYTKQILFIWLFSVGVALNIRNSQKSVRTLNNTEISI